MHNLATYSKVVWYLHTVKYFFLSKIGKKCTAKITQVINSRIVTLKSFLLQQDCERTPEFFTLFKSWMTPYTTARYSYSSDTPWQVHIYSFKSNKQQFGNWHPEVWSPERGANPSVTPRGIWKGSKFLAEFSDDMFVLSAPTIHGIWSVFFRNWDESHFP